MNIKVLTVCAFLFLHILTIGQVKPAIYDVQFYKLDLSVSIDQQSINGSNKIVLEVLENTSKLDLHLAKQFNIHSIVHNNKELTFTRAGDTIAVFFGRVLAKGSYQTLTIRYSGEPQIAVNPPWDGGFIWGKDSLDRPWVGVTCEGIGASTWWPCNGDIRDKADSIQINVTIPKTVDSLRAICNGQLKGVLYNKDSTTFQWLITYPITNYNLTLNVGVYHDINERFSSINGDTFSLDYYVLDYHEVLAKKHFTQVPIILRAFEELYGPYPFRQDGYALIETSYWGMEHQSGISYGNNFISNAIGYDFIVLHESGHEYWGNAVGINDFAELWINEAFATYTETLFFEKVYTKEEAFKYLQYQKNQIKNTEALLGEFNVNFKFETTDIYYKGAWMLHTLRTALNNDECFFKILREIQLNYKYKTISTLEILAVFKKHITSFNVESVMMHYLTNTTYPELDFLLIEKKDEQVFQFRWNGVSKAFDLPLWLVVVGELVQVVPNKKIVGDKIELLWLDHYLIER